MTIVTIVTIVLVCVFKLIALAADCCTSRCWNPLHYTVTLHRLTVSILTVFNLVTTLANGRLTLPAAKCNVLLVFTSVTAMFLLPRTSVSEHQRAAQTFKWHCNKAPKSALLFRSVDTGNRCHMSTVF